LYIPYEIEKKKVIQIIKTEISIFSNCGHIG
jgi:hypothetical protein